MGFFFAGQTAAWRCTPYALKWLFIIIKLLLRTAFRLKLNCVFRRPNLHANSSLSHAPLIAPVRHMCERKVNKRKLDNTTSIACGTFVQNHTQMHHSPTHPYRRLSGQRDAAPWYASYSQKAMAKHRSSHNYCKWISEHIFRIKVKCLLIQPQSGASQTLRLPAALFDCYIRATKQQVETFEYIFLFSFSLISYFLSLLSSSSITLTYIITF